MMLTLDKIYHAAFVLKNVARKTDLIKATKLSEKCELYLKTENLQETGSFKLRGAYYKISQLTDEEKERGIIACSAGNHAQGVAMAASHNGIKAIICMPDGAPISKVESTKQLGAEVRLVKGVYDDAYNEALRLQEETGATFIHPFDDDQVIARSSVYQELCERSGAHTFAEFWDKHFEINALTQDTMSYLHQLYNYCYLIRQGIDEEQEPFTVQRELFMLKSLQAAMKTHKRILVVTGGLHSVALCDYLYFKKKKATAMRYPKVPSETYLIPYSFAAADSQTGYGAGVVFPYYFQQFYTVLKGLVPFMPAPERELPALEVVGGDESPEAVAHVSSDTENEPSNAVTADTTAIAETVIAETAVAETAVADVAEAVGLDEEQAVI